MASFLQDYVDSIAELPAQLQRIFSLMRELDEKAINLQSEIDQICEKHTSSSGSGQGKRKRDHDAASAEAQIEPLSKQCLQITDEKVTLAVQTYDLVDVHIRRLDQDLARFEDQLKQEDQKAGIESKQDIKALAKGPIVPLRLKREKTTGAGNEGSKSKKGSVAQAMSPDASGPTRGMGGDLDLPIDPNEPTYCFCNRVSFGEMIACDNSECKIEWFHFECVGLSRDHKTKGKWFCPDCQNLKRKGKLRV